MFIFFFCSAVYGQSDKIAIKVFGSSATNDFTGKRLVYNVKEYFRTSQRFELVDEKSDALFIVVIKTISPFDVGLLSMYSIVWMLNFESDTPYYYYLNSNVGYCGRDHIYETAESLVAVTDKIVTQNKKTLSEWADK